MAFNLVPKSRTRLGKVCERCHSSVPCLSPKRKISACRGHESAWHQDSGVESQVKACWGRCRGYKAELSVTTVCMRVCVHPRLW